MATRAAINQLACLLIALLLWLLRVEDSYWSGLVFSLLIGNSCWLLIDVGRALVAHWRFERHGGVPEWPGWPWMAPIVIVGTVLGYLIGHAAAKALLGLPAGMAMLHTPVLGFIVISAMTITYLFYARERVHSQHLQAMSAERLASQMQLKLLQMQLEPHMLFNTLANLRALIWQDQAQAQVMLDHLIAFLRTTLASTRVDSHSLKAEFDALNDYLSLMRERMGARLQSCFELPESLRELPVPPLLLQPLIENAIKHGLEPKVEGGRIEIGARREGDRVCLRVRDTGIGLSADAHTAGTTFGLDQVRMRLTTLYGNQATLTLQPAVDAEGGTEALILMPIR